MPSYRTPHIRNKVATNRLLWLAIGMHGCTQLAMSLANEEVLMDFATKVLSSKPDYPAPDGSEVRLLLKMTRGEMAHFALRSRGVSKAVVHASIEEIWYFVAGRGRLWRSQSGKAGGEIVDVFPGVSIAIPPHTHFQFRNDGDGTLEAVSATMPCWPGPDEATLVEGIWDPTEPPSAA